MRPERYEIRLSGSGGQGLILAGIILAEAASIYENRNAVQTQSYGPEARGGASKSEVVISDTEIDYPKVIKPNLLLAMTQEAVDKYSSDFAANGIIVTDSSTLQKVPDSGNVYSIPMTAIAKEVTGRTISANIVALGAIVAISGIVSRQAIEKAVVNRIPKGTEDVNRKALLAGFKAGDEVLNATTSHTIKN